MKKIIFFTLSVLLSSLLFTSCNLIEPSVNFYQYQIDKSITTLTSSISGTIGSDVSGIESVLGSKLNKLFELTEEEAYLEWDSVIAAIQKKSNIEFIDDDYYEVTFVECVITDDDKMKDGKVIGKKRWDATTHPAK